MRLKAGAGRILRISLARRRSAPAVGQLVLAALLLAGCGCGTTRMSDTQRTATEQLLISNAVDQVVSQLDFRCLAGKPVYFDPQYLDGTVDRGYVISSLRQQLLASGCVLQEERAKAIYVVEARSGCVGTNRHSLLVGVPQMTVPAFVPGQPSQIPEIPLAKKNDEQGAAKLAVFAYNRLTGQRVWQSGTVEATSDARDMWVAGLGPFRNGTIAHGTELAGEELSLPLHRDDKDAGRRTRDIPPATSAATWREPPTRPAGNRSVFTVLAEAALGKHYDSDKAAASAAAADKQTVTSASKSVSSNPLESASSTAAKPASSPPAAPNAGGHAETAPAVIMMSGLGNAPSGS